MITPANRLPSVSVIVPTLNRPAMLQRAVDSIVAQEFGPTELIIIDDARPLGLRTIHQMVGLHRLQNLVVAENNRTSGASGARNRGAELATGNVLAFLDDDDEWAPEYLNKAISLLASDDLNVVCSDFVTVSNDGDVLPGKDAPDKLSPDLFLTRNAGIIGSNLVIAKQLFWDIGGFNETLPSLNDMDLGITLSLHAETRFAPLHLPLVRHHQHDEARLSTPRIAAKAQGIRRFYQLHSFRMSRSQRSEFRERAIRLWGVDEQGQIV